VGCPGRGRGGKGNAFGFDWESRWVRLENGKGRRVEEALGGPPTELLCSTEERAPSAGTLEERAGGGRRAPRMRRHSVPMHDPRVMKSGSRLTWLGRDVPATPILAFPSARPICQRGPWAIEWDAIEVSVTVLFRCLEWQEQKTAACEKDGQSSNAWYPTVASRTRA